MGSSPWIPSNMDFSAFMDKKLGGKYAGPPGRRGGRREDASTIPTSAPLDDTSTPPGSSSASPGSSSAPPGPSSALQEPSSAPPSSSSAPLGSSSAPPGSSYAPPGPPAPTFRPQVFSTPARSNRPSPIHHLCSPSRSPLPTRTDNLLELAKKKRGQEEVVKEVRNSEGSFFSIYNEDDDFSDKEGADTIAETKEACSKTKRTDSKDKETDPKNKEAYPKDKETDPRDKVIDPKDTEPDPKDTETFIQAHENSNKTKTKKRKTPKEVRQAEPKPKLRSNPRAHQNWNERYLTVKKKVDTLQPDHNLPQDFFLAVRNNMHNQNVRNSSKTAGKLMVHGKGDTMKAFMDGRLKNQKDCFIMANAIDMNQIETELEEDSVEEEEGLGEEVPSPLTERERKRRRRQDREDSPPPDIFDMASQAISVRTPGS